MLFETNVMFEPISLKRHRHRQNGTTYDPSSKDKTNFVKLIELPQTKMTNPIKCVLHFYSTRPKTHFRIGKYSHILKPNAPKHNVCNKDIDNMVKFVLDALNNKLYIDDCQIVEIKCGKYYAEKEGYVYMHFEEIVDEQDTTLE